jgi:glycosyltransferase involved in cell wall biosynthesis
MKRVLLFDIHSGGHHLEYASKIKTFIDNNSAPLTAEFLVPERDEKCNEYFSSYNYLYSRGTLPPLSDSPIELRYELVFDALDYADENRFDMFHFMCLDDITKAVNDACTQKKPNIPLSASLIGAYFNEKSQLRKLLGYLERSVVLSPLSNLVPDKIHKYLIYGNDIYLNKIMERNVLEQIFVPNYPAKEYLCDLNHQFGNNSVTVVPDPTELYFEKYEKYNSREVLNLPTDQTILLFFGGLRRDKGIFTLLNAIEKYNGPEFTLLLAGEGRDITESDIRKIQDQVLPSIRCDLQYIPDKMLPHYFIASDAVVTPYLRSFGDRTPSNVFQKAAGANRPVIAPNFGMFKRKVSEWNLGITFEPGSPDKLAGAIHSLILDIDDIGDSEQRKEYAKTQTYEELGKCFLDHFKTSLEITGSV